MKRFLLVPAVCSALVLAACGGGDGDAASAAPTGLLSAALPAQPGAPGQPPQPAAPGVMTAKAVLQNFIANDPLQGDNGLPTSPAAPLRYGPINLGIDVDGNAIQAVDEVDIKYFEGHYYLYGPSFTCGSFNHAAGVNTGPLIPTNPGSFYRYCGLTVYKSDDLMHWKLVDTQYLQDPATGEHYYVKKPRIVYSEKTGLYNMWFLNGQAGQTRVGRTGKRYIVQSRSPEGPWGAPFEPTVAVGEFGPGDFAIATGPDGKSYIATSHGVLNTLQLNDEKTGTIDYTDIEFAAGTIGGGVGLSYKDGWWYMTGSAGCGNCLASRFYYLMARDPHGPWMSPETMSSAVPLQPALLSADSGLAQMKAPVSLPDANGAMQLLLPGTHYVSSPTGAPGNAVSQPGDNNLALSGLYLTPLQVNSDGRIQPITIKPSNEFALAKPVVTSVPAAYQAALTITSSRSVVQSWELRQGEPLAVVLPSVFQRTPDLSTTGATGGRAVPQQPNVNAPLEAKLELPDGQEHTWSIDPRTVAWAPTKVPLNLPEAFKGRGRVTLTLSTTATNGGYGVAVGDAGRLPGGSYAAVKAGVSTVVPRAEMLLETSHKPAGAPKITLQPAGVRVAAGTAIGFLVKAEGVGLGYQWYRNGQPILAPDGYNESTTAALRIAGASPTDAGVYTVEVFNQVGSVTSEPVTVEVTP
jgi:hypothetical protein